MSNPYKEIVQKIAEGVPFLYNRTAKGRSFSTCIYCYSSYDPNTQEERPFKHQEDCLYLKAQTLLAQNPDSEKDPWIPCSESEGLPKEDGDYYVTVSEYNDLDTYLDQFKNGKWVDQLQHQVIAYMPAPKPYQPPAPTPEPDNKYRTTVIGRIVKKNGEVTVEPIPEPEKTQELQPDPLMGWTPIWKEKPDTFEDVRVLIESPLMELSGWLNEDGMWRVYYTYNQPVLLLPEHKIVAWRDSNPIPNPELFEKPTSPPPKHLPIHFIPFADESPKQPGHYVLHNAEMGDWHYADISETLSRKSIEQYKNYTHWALVKKEE